MNVNNDCGPLILTNYKYTNWRDDMPKLRHIALATDDPDKTAAFYIEAFDFKEVGRVGNPDDPDNGLAAYRTLWSLLVTSAAGLPSALVMHPRWV